MRVHVYTTLRNEAYLLPFFLRHYATVADHIFVLDDGSTDGSLAIIEACPIASVLPYPFETGLDDRVLQDALHQAIATHSSQVADWVLCPDADELLFHPELRSVLADHHERGVRCIGSTAWRRPSPGTGSPR